MNFQPLIIVGAGRSGTNILRDSLTRLPQFATWDCDEINPVWRYGLPMSASDELEMEQLLPRGRRAIRAAFSKVARNHCEARFVVEKTCANSLRLGYVEAAVPGAVYLQLVRDGRDVVPSAAKRWRGELEVESRSYFLSKARNTPLLALPSYFWQFLRARLRKLIGASERLSTWGPRYEGIEQDLDMPLEHICARQWRACVDRSDVFFERHDSARWKRIYYEDFIADPAATLAGVLDFLSVDVPDADIEQAVQAVRRREKKSSLDMVLDAEQERLFEMMEPTLTKHSYLEKSQ